MVGPVDGVEPWLGKVDDALRVSVAFGSWLLVNWIVADSFIGPIGNAFQIALGFAVSMAVALVASQKVWLPPIIRVAWSDGSDNIQGDALALKFRNADDIASRGIHVTRNRTSFLSWLLLRKHPTGAARLEIQFSSPDDVDVAIDYPETSSIFALRDRIVIELDDVRNHGVLANIGCSIAITGEPRPLEVTLASRLIPNDTVQQGTKRPRVLLVSPIKRMILRRAT